MKPKMGQWEARIWFFFCYFVNKRLIYKILKSLLLISTLLELWWNCGELDNICAVHALYIHLHHNHLLFINQVLDFKTVSMILRLMTLHTVVSQVLCCSAILCNKVFHKLYKIKQMLNADGGAGGKHRHRHEEGMSWHTQWIVDYAWQLGEDGFVFTRSWISQ